MLLPYYCRGCGKTGNLLCGDCKSDIEIIGLVQDKELGEIAELYAGGIREGTLRRLVEDYKFKSVKRIVKILAGILDEATGEMSRETIIVPLPTIRKHIRERGFDHTKKLAEELAELRGLEVREVLRRVNKTVQVGADEETRERQAAEAYAVDMEKFELGRNYLLLDDVWTTGASMRAAAEKLREAGAGRISGAVVEIGRLA